MLSSNTSAVSGDTTYVEDVFSTYLYTGTGAAQSINNGIDLAANGGMVWTKSRSNAVSNIVVDSVRGGTNALVTNSTAANSADTGYHISSFNSNGYSLQGAGSGDNFSGYTYASWTFRKQPKFFDVVTYTGTGSNRTIAHNLGSVPGSIIIKRTDTTADWAVYHRSLANTEFLVLNSTAAAASSASWWNGTTPTSVVFSLGTDASVNASGGTYVAYIYAHDAGGFGLTSTDNVISCGSYTGNGSATGPVVTLGYEPQWLLIKNTNNPSAWFLQDTMRGMPLIGSTNVLLPNNSVEEQTGVLYVAPNATGFQLLNSSASVNSSGGTYIYIAIRRGPMKVPTDATKVFAPVTRTGASSTVTSNTNPDLVIPEPRIAGYGRAWLDKLRGKIGFILSNSTNAEYAGATATITDWQNTGVLYNSAAGGPANDSGVAYVDYYLTRAPSFFDEVCYTGTGANRTVTHNLGVTPELFIVKRRDTTSSWNTYVQAIGNTNYLAVETTAASTASATRWNNTSPTSTQFSLGTFAGVNASGGTYVAYLFATCAGVSKVGNYTGTGTTKQIDCGFAAGARFVLIKRTDSTGDWYVWDTARGIVSGNDPYLLLNSTAAEVTSTDYIDAYSAGFELSSTAPAALNASGGTYIFLAIA